MGFYLPVRISTSKVEHSTQDGLCHKSQLQRPSQLPTGLVEWAMAVEVGWGNCPTNLEAFFKIELEKIT